MMAKEVITFADDAEVRAEKACYRSSGESLFPEANAVFEQSGPRSRRGDGFPVQNHPDLAAQEIDQDRHALVIRHALEQPEAGVEHAVDHPDLVAAHEARTPIEL